MYDIAIIGAGPAGASAAIFAAKSGKKTLVLDNDKGMTRKAWFENYYGLEEISGPDLVDTGIQQIKRLGAEYIKDQALDITNNNSSFTLYTEASGDFEAKHIILAPSMLG